MIIDPAKNKHPAVVLGPDGSTAGRSFSFTTNHIGFTETRPQRIKQRLRDDTEVVYAIEGSCALGQNLAFPLSDQGHDVVLVSPLAPYHARPSSTGAFSRSDQKDAELIARLARQGPTARWPATQTTSGTSTACPSRRESRLPDWAH